MKSSIKAKSSKFKFTLIILSGVSVIMLFPILTNFIMTLSWFEIAGDKNTWISFYGSYLGGITGGLLTLGGVLLTLNHQKESKEQDSKVEEHKTLLLMYPKFLLILSNLKNIKFSLVHNDLYEMEDIEHEMLKWRIKSLSEKVNLLEGIDLK
ncbi:hypothetical protein [Halobacillus ihumii]|uniref:hypothetical protein n=1 Tax=Halobacillus ihumii TaxID=2686092 RepID=UPI0013D827F2|nr:hypothetical protein [Halobacillus ihumii]